jgi:hypothetical protein
MALALVVIEEFIYASWCFCLSRFAKTARLRDEGAWPMPRPPDFYDMPDEPRGAMRLAQGLLIAAIMLLIVIAWVSSH